MSAQQTAPAKGVHSVVTFTLASTAFASGAAIPDEYTCRGADVSPLLSWTDSPPGTTSFALIVDDPDAPAGTWVHWVIWNIPHTTQLMPKNVMKSGTLPDGSAQGRNDFGSIGYNGPCPPPGKTHRYFFRLYALDAKLALQPGATRQQLEAAMKGHVIGKAEHMGTYRR
jgi:Raf kinase inhibitor-like YbhB/YbcL family protein